MSTTISPLLPSTLNVKTLQADTVKAKTVMISGTVMTNGYMSVAGPASVIITGDDQTYPVANVCAGMIVRTGLTGTVDILPSATAMAAELGLKPVEGVSYIRTLVIFVDDSSSVEISGTGWSISGSSISGYYSSIFSYALSYTAEDGWEILCIKTGEYNTD
jgi:hypothetical protein